MVEGCEEEVLTGATAGAWEADMVGGERAGTTGENADRGELYLITARSWPGRRRRRTPARLRLPPNPDALRPIGARSRKILHRSCRHSSSFFAQSR